MSLVAALLLAALGIGGGLAAGRRFGSRPSGAPRAAGAEGGATPSTAVGVVSSDAIDAGGGESPHRAERVRARVVAAAASGEHMGGAAPRIALDRPTPSGVGVEIHGRDPIAPRALELWRIAGERAVLAAQGASRADGTLAFAPFVLPAGELALVVAPAGQGAFAPGASPPVSTSRDPASPRVEALGEAAGGLRVRVVPSELGGEILVAEPAVGGAEPEVFARVGLAPTPDGPARTLELRVEPAPGADALLFAQRLADGRRSPWQSLPAPTTSNPRETTDVP